MSTRTSRKRHHDQCQLVHDGKRCPKRAVGGFQLHRSGYTARLCRACAAATGATRVPDVYRDGT